MRKEEFISYNQAQTEDIGARLAQALTGGEVLALYGGLGAGKTAFTRGLARGLGIARPVTSPTFTLLHQYKGRLALSHFDVYRLSSAEEAEDIGIDEIMQADGVTVIEWPERVEELLDDRTIVIKIEGSGDEPRVLTVLWP
ncbi:MULTISPECIES: tRNA (adenosine(37)-N6)-threonylcarbamoyltransferase complex ATPase subunit type 1 TsaE [unclassified Clostridium]|jgi:tRNA threonylcarbamoyladenosine biosynthesis protein TsaE|uniref:tRNA (adenosine(37)-N6)-threonylcarbamoyltransferase complex ATPase subunit type 1 TsaE n=1 Tax=Clostridia TaxID=186801 RepID=UPI001106D9B5|nr:MULTISPECIES: tRNA (adenosine(37)-N6)-threonylcarbamoyltransferase complex ATPase subunit type 1 TsaE [unclassified Clostridium]